MAAPAPALAPLYPSICPLSLPECPDVPAIRIRPLTVGVLCPAFSHIFRAPSWWQRSSTFRRAELERHHSRSRRFPSPSPYACLGDPDPKQNSVSERRQPSSWRNLRDRSRPVGGRWIVHVLGARCSPSGGGGRRSISVPPACGSFIHTSFTQTSFRRHDQLIKRLAGHAAAASPAELGDGDETGADAANSDTARLETRQQRHRVAGARTLIVTELFCSPRVVMAAFLFGGDTDKASRNTI